MDTLTGDYAQLASLPHWKRNGVRRRSRAQRAEGRASGFPSIRERRARRAAIWKRPRPRTNRKARVGAARSRGSWASNSTPAPTPRTGFAVSSPCSSSTQPKTSYLRPTRTHLYAVGLVLAVVSGFLLAVDIILDQLRKARQLKLGMSMRRHAEHRSNERPLQAGKTTGVNKNRLVRQDYLTSGERLRRIAALLLKAMYMNSAFDCNEIQRHDDRDTAGRVLFSQELSDGGGPDPSHRDRPNDAQAR